MCVCVDSMCVFVERTSVNVLALVDELHDHGSLRSVDQRDHLPVLTTHVHQTEHNLALKGGQGQGKITG